MLLTEKVFNKNGNNINLGLAPWVSTRILLFYKKSGIIDFAPDYLRPWCQFSRQCACDFNWINKTYLQLFC